MNHALAVTKALADQNRLRILMALRGSTLCLCRLTEILRIAPSTVSKHLQLLSNAGLVSSRQDGRWRYYRLTSGKPDSCEERALECVFELERDTTEAEVNQLFAEASQGSLKGILCFERKPLVSTDFEGDTRSGIVDGPATMVVDGNHLKVLVWYDHEVGYVNRMMELARKVALTLPGKE